ncbi:MAG: sigma-70 family RNA polymerase sigma factor [Longimicrobiales bacterium]
MGEIAGVSVDWADVYRTTYDDLVRYLYRKVWDAERAQELAQEAFVRVLDHTPDNARAWLFSVAGNLARDEVRTVIRRRKHLTLIKAESTEVAAEPDPVETIDRDQKLGAAKRALDELSERDREVLLLWDAGLSYTEIAERTGLAVGAIGTTLSRARRKLVAAYDAVEGSHVARG